ncbi:MAG TPA: phosphatidylserine decarboxylase [Bradyrhizobium sp.]|nr:phosphatidylserine decarboxylase [Bradyrhizobium sp.]
MSKPVPLPVWDRKNGKLVRDFMDDSTSTYESRPRRSLTQWLQSHPAYDWLLAAYQNTGFSARKIEPFIRKHGIDMSEFEEAEYRSYAEFFERRFKPGKRSFPASPNEMGAFAEARYFGWEKVVEDQRFPIKGHSLDAAQLLGGTDRASPFIGGPVLLVRLAPVDYHHVHYPDDGTTLEHDRLGYRLWTVNRNALQNQPDILLRNERHINILMTRNFGRLGFIEIGALSVGRIVQVHPLKKPFTRGEEKSIFRFGGSAIAVFGERGAWRPADDVLEKTSAGTETYLRLGELVAQRIR